MHYLINFVKHLIKVVFHLQQQMIKQIILGHLSKENNRPDIALAESERALGGCGVRLCCAPVYGCLSLEVKEGALC